MSENDNNEIESEVIDSELVEGEDTQIAIEQTVVKKGSLLSFFAFVMSFTAIALSGYMYYLDSIASPQQDITNSWKDALSQSDNKASSKIESLENQLKQIETSHLQLTNQMKKLQENLQQDATSESNGLVPNQSNEPFDDSVLVQQVSELKNKLTQQDALIEKLQSNLDSSIAKNSQSLELLSADIKNQLTNQPTGISTITEGTKVKALVGTLLQETYVQLDINRNVIRSQALIVQIIDQLSLLTGMRYGYLSRDLESLSEQLDLVEQVDTQAITAQINQMSESTRQLEFISVEESKNLDEKSSWYDNLITIQKIDENAQPILSKGEKITVMNVISNHFQMLKIALMSHNQMLWIAEIEQIQELLMKHFASNAQQISDELLAFKDINLNPKLPEMAKYLQQFKSINLANENE
jgi:uncharacterized protein HemX